MLYRLKAVCEITGLTERAVRLYERRGLLRDVRRTTGNWREYSERDLDRLRLIVKMRRLDMSIEEMGIVLKVVEGSALGDDTVGLRQLRALIASTRAHLEVADLMARGLERRAARFMRPVAASPAGGKESALPAALRITSFRPPGPGAPAA